MDSNLKIYKLMVFSDNGIKTKELTRVNLISENSILHIFCFEMAA